ncbi:bifunctional phosphopantothenoylcysteine decarboxylase/phosphopantothenate--cysteine ligase CoaBC [Spartinivicinus ruber]|uniref:bifunctional phosphopantothenoylcysteine decarboxylase/phosphopantothenate--cysteine ligase CoaBC n=1 Tax=Spartinivicinus ruber TaxID=2683272 RepID=UPI0013D38799|nr:bifunctional phosphopantothenoylcysteine decarboxylase/phosphopantothenate--cysteine ligase CoaBC [Spartinivicinus ruber]
MTLATLSNKRIIVGIAGGIAAYKSAELVRRLKEQGAEVRVVMTEAAQSFITPLTLQAVSGNPVHMDLLDPAAEAAMGHIELARWADLVLIAPATADLMARMAAGQGNDLLTTLCLATEAPICLAPAMNQAMWRDASTQHNATVLLERGIQCFGPAEGEQACGDIGPGRMLEPTQLADSCAQQFQSEKLTGKHVVITAGPTQEAIDPVRYISNHSSGKMGFALAEAAVAAGAKVTLIAGPVTLATPDRVVRVDVISAMDMYQATHQVIPDADIFIACAAVADYRPEQVADHKLKKDPTVAEDEMIIRLVRNPDIVASVASQPSKPFVVGFAAETQDIINYAKDKLEHKNLDMIIANNVADTTVGFNSDDNAVTVISREVEEPFPPMAKTLLARKLIDFISHAVNNQH